MNYKCGWWHACYRRASIGSILSDRQPEFHVIRNNWYASVMDPFVFEHDGETYIFAELYNIFLERGTIGYAKWDKEKEQFGKWVTVLIEPFHLSYPYVFYCENQIYMIPEAYESGRVILYKAVSFPDKWEQVRTLKDNVKYVDTSYFKAAGGQYAFTYDISDQKDKKLLLYKLDDNLIFTEEARFITNEDKLARPGGYVFSLNNSLIRVGQDCDGEYGKALVFMKMAENWNHKYSEKQLLHFGIENLILDRQVSKIGVHNYSATEHFEVIDVKGRIFHPIELAARCVYKLRKRRKH